MLCNGISLIWILLGIALVCVIGSMVVAGFGSGGGGGYG